jgi:protoporphyrinogen/coproporphyrinogen III oxidase
VSERRRVAVLGGGVAGLAAAHRLTELAPEVEVVLVEARDRLGGTIETERSGGFTIEGGADSMITEKPWAVALCERLGFASRLIGTREGERRTFVVHAGRLEPLPDGFLLLAPTSLAPLARSRIFSWAGKLRMALDLVIPRGRGGDESLAAFVRRRLGREALERVAQPLVGGIYTADPERLSLAATMPRFLEIERRHRSLILGLRRGATGGQGGAGARYSLFVAPDEGMGAFVAAIAARLPEGAVRLRAPVPGLARVGERWRLTAGGEPITADALVVATPAHVAATLLGPHDAPLGRALDEIDYASSATVTLGYRTADLPPLRGFGFVVPAIERRSLLACTYASRKFAGRAPEGHDLVRGFVGGALRPELGGLADDALVGLVRDELRTLVGVTASPELVRLRRYPRAMPQYDVGHLDRVAAIERRAALLPRVVLAGAAYRGVGVPDCVRSGEAAAEAVLRDLKREPGASP